MPSMMQTGRWATLRVGVMVKVGIGLGLGLGLGLGDTICKPSSRISKQLLHLEPRVTLIFALRLVSYSQGQSEVEVFHPSLQA